MKLSVAIEEFLIACEADGLSDASLNWYKSILGRFERAFSDSDLRAIGANDLRHYVIGLKEDYSSENTRASYQRPVHRFWKWAAIEYGIVNPMRNIRYPPQPVPKHRAAELDDILKMFQAANTRDRAIIAFLLDTGARAGGICGLKLQDVDLERRTAIVTEKGHKTRQVPFKEFTAAAIQEWLKMRLPEAEYLFHALDSGEQLQPNGLYQALRRLGKRAGVKGRFNPHALRHAFSNGFYEAGGGKYLVELARIMGHKDLRTLITHYLNRTDDHVRAAHDSFSPIDEFAALLENGQTKAPKKGPTESG